MKRSITRLTALLLAAGITLSVQAETFAEATETTVASAETAEQQTTSETKEEEKTEEEQTTEKTETKEEKVPDFYVDYYDKEEDSDPERRKYYYYSKGGFNRDYRDYIKLSTEQLSSMTDEYLKYITNVYEMSTFKTYNKEIKYGVTGESDRDTYKDEVYKTLSDLYDYIYTSCEFHDEVVPGAHFNFSDVDNEDLEYYARVDVKVYYRDYTKEALGPDLRIILRDNFLYLDDCFGTYYDITVPEPKKMFDMIDKLVDILNPPRTEAIEILKKDVNLDNMTYGGKEMKCLEKLTFTVPVTKEICRSFLGVLTNEGETLKFTVNQVYTNEWLFFMTIEGSNGKKVLWRDNENNIGSYRAYEKFYESDTIDENHNLVYDGNCWPNNAVTIKGSADDDEITGVNINVDSRGIGDASYNVKADGENIKYEFYGKDYTVEGGRNLYTILSLTYEKVQKELEEKKQQEKANQTNTILFKGYTDDKSMYLDYKVLFAAQADLDVEEAVAPKWYKELGSDVKVTILSLMRRIDGKEKRPPYLLMRLKGSEKSRWFKIDSETPSKNLSNEDTEYLGDLHYDMEFRSVKSFDGKNLVGQDYSDSDIIHASIRFDYAESQSVLSGIDFIIESQKTEVDAENLKYIGGGRTLYENIFYSTDGDTYYGNN